MSKDGLQNDLREFILANIDSISHLEALLLLRQSPKETWDAQKAARRLYTTDEAAQILLERLRRDGFLEEVEGGYRYGCVSAEHELMIARLAKEYARHLIPITNMIHAKRRRQFIDSFAWRNED